MANTQRFENNLSIRIVEGVSPDETIFTVADTSQLNPLTDGDYYIGTIQPFGGLGRLEIVRITGFTENTLVVVRGQEGTSAQSFLPGATVGIRITANFLNKVSNRVQQTLSVADAGAKGDGGLTDPFLAFKTVIENAPEGSTVYIPPGHYKTVYRDISNSDNWIHLTKSIYIEAVPGSVILENFLFYPHGQYGSLQLVGSAGFTSGDTSINTATPHGLVAGDYVQLLSSVNAGSTDAGEWQMESVNPTTGAAGSLRLSEIHRVHSVPDSTTATLLDPVIYPGYKDNVSGYAFPLPGLVGAQIRKLTMPDGITFRGIQFKNVTADQFRSILVRCVSNIMFEDCSFVAAEQRGAFFKSTDTYGVTFLRCQQQRKPVGASGSNWNSFLPGAGTTDIRFINCDMEGGHQTIDVTPLTHASDIGATPESELKTGQLSVQNITIQDCNLSGSSDGFTTHPGCYNVLVSNNRITGCSTGVRIRSLKNSITDNIIDSVSAGVVLSGFYDLTVISGNVLSDTLNAALWSGVQVVPMSSETMNNNNMRAVSITGNQMNCRYSTGARAGILLRHFDNGTPPPGFTGFTDAIKTALSNYVISNNVFTGCSVTVNQYISGVSVVNNVFGGSNGSAPATYVNLSSGSSAAYVQNNLFLDNVATSITVSAPSLLVFPFEKRHSIGNNYGKGTITSSMNTSNVVPDTAIGPQGGTSAPNPGVITSGTWTPTVTGVNNVSTVTPYVCQYTRVGGIVTVVGQVGIAAAASGATSVLVTLPFPSDFVATTDASGTVASQTTTESGVIVASSTNDAITLQYSASTLTENIFKFSGSYRII